MLRTPRLAAAALLATPALAAAQQITTLLLEGDPVAGGGNVSFVVQVVVDDLGGWAAEIDTTAPTSVDRVVLHDGAVLLREGDALLRPAGATVAHFGQVSLVTAGHLGLELDFGGAVTAADDAGLFQDTTLLLREGDFSAAPQLTLGTRYLSFQGLQLNAAGQTFGFAFVDDLALPSALDRVLLRLDTDGAGTVLGETVLLKEGDPVGSQGFAISDFAREANAWDVNDAGSVLCRARVASGTNDDMVVLLDGVAIAEEGGPSPLPGRTWRSLDLASVSLNDTGGWALRGELTGALATSELLVVSGAPFRQEGDNLPAIGGFHLTDVGAGAGALDLADTGQVLWYGQWDDAVTTINEGLFVDDVLLVQEGVTTIGGATVRDLRPGAGGFALSGNGRFVIFAAELDGSQEGVFLIDLGNQGTVYCAGDGSAAACPCSNTGAPGAGCANSAGAGARLAALGSGSVSADDFALQATDLVPNQPALCFAGDARVAGGTGATFGDGLRCAGGTVTRLGVRPADAQGQTLFGPALAAQGGWAPGDQRHFQVWYRDPVGSPCGSGFNLTPGVTLDFLP